MRLGGERDGTLRSTVERVTVLGQGFDDAGLELVLVDLECTCEACGHDGLLLMGLNVRPSGRMLVLRRHAVTTEMAAWPPMIASGISLGALLASELVALTAANSNNRFASRLASTVRLRAIEYFKHCSGVRFLPRFARPIFALCSGYGDLPGLPFFARDIASHQAFECGTPLRYSDILRRVSADAFSPVCARRMFSICSGENFIPRRARDYLYRVSLLTSLPDASGGIAAMGFML